MGKGRPDEPWNEDVTQMQKRNRVEKQITPSKQTSRRRMQTNQAHRRQRHAENCGLQTITASGTKREMAIKRLGEGEKDQPSTHKELFLFFQEMDEWESLDQRLVCVMREIHAEPVRITEDDKLEVVITYMLKLVALQNGVANCSQHALGCKWRAVHDRHDDDKGNKERIGSSLDMLQDNLNNAQYVLYGASLAKCGCEECTACIQFDKIYNQ